MDPKTFRKHAHDLVDWMADYLEGVSEYPVKSQVTPREIFNTLSTHPPQQGEPFPNIFADFVNKIMPGITHWQHPHFYAYFPANSSAPSILGEMVMATLGAQCMIWDTSPAAAELEEMMMNWLQQMLDLPPHFTGVIQDTASSATLCALLTAREKKSNWEINTSGFGKQQNPKLRIYCSAETHSSIEKGVKIAGIGKENCIKIPVDENLGLCTDELEKAIQQDLSNGFVPMCVVGTIGTTSTTAIDPIEKIGIICKKYDLWLHVDAAYAGSAMILPEYAYLRNGLEHADSFVFNPHKWMLTNFDCSAYFVADTKSLLRTFEILPEYLKTHNRGQVNDYRDWGIPLGRRFRALKLWFVLRSYGVEGIQELLRTHMDLTRYLQTQIENHRDFEVVFPARFNLLGFRYAPQNIPLNRLNELNQRLINKLNQTGKIYLTHTKVHNRYTLRIVIGQPNSTIEHVQNAWQLIEETAAQLV